MGGLGGPGVRAGIQSTPPRQVCHAGNQSGGLLESVLYFQLAVTGGRQFCQFPAKMFGAREVRAEIQNTPPRQVCRDPTWRTFGLHFVFAVRPLALTKARRPIGATWARTARFRPRRKPRHHMPTISWELRSEMGHLSPPTAPTPPRQTKFGVESN